MSSIKHSFNLSVCFLIICFKGFNQTHVDYSYKKALKEYVLISKISQYYYTDSMSKTDWEELNRIASNISFPYNQSVVDNVYFSIYDQTGPIEKAAEYYKKVLFYGTYLDKNKLRKYEDLINYDSLFMAKEKNMDTTILNFFTTWRREVLEYDSNYNLVVYENDYLFLPKLDSLVNKYGKWPGFDIRGNVSIYKNKPYYIRIYPHLMNEKQTSKYLKLITEECKKGNENWNLVPSISTQCIRNSIYQERFYKIRNLKLEGKSFDFYDDYTTLTLRSLASFIKWKTIENGTVNIYPTELWGGADYQVYLDELIYDLYSKGVSLDKINMMDTVIKMDNNEQIAHDYLFVFEIKNQDEN